MTRTVSALPVRPISSGVFWVSVIVAVVAVVSWVKSYEKLIHESEPDHPHGIHT